MPEISAVRMRVPKTYEFADSFLRSEAGKLLAAGVHHSGVDLVVDEIVHLEDAVAQVLPVL